MKRWTVLLSAFTAAALMSGCSLLPQEEEPLAPPLKAPAAVTYTTVKPQRGTIIDSINVSGTFISTTSYNLAFDKRSGYLSEILVEPGASVKKGDLLARLDTESLELSLRMQELTTERAGIILNQAKNAPNATEDSIRLAEIDYQIQCLQLETKRSELNKQSIYAPGDGVVSYMSKFSVGEFVPARSTFVQLVDPTALQIECRGDEIKNFRLNQDVVVTIDKKEYAGKVVMTPSDAPLAIKTDKEPFIRIEVTDQLPDQELLGESVSVEMIRDQKEDALIVPRNVVFMYADESYVLVLEDGVKKERIIKTGIKNITQIEVLDGLKEGEEIIIK